MRCTPRDEVKNGLLCFSSSVRMSDDDEEEVTEGADECDLTPPPAVNLSKECPRKVSKDWPNGQPDASHSVVSSAESLDNID